MGKNKNPKILYILSNSFSGSTLLTRILDLAPKIFGAGEFCWTHRLSPGITDKNRIQECPCGVDARECEIWKTVSGHNESDYFSSRTVNTSLVGRLQYLKRVMVSGKSQINKQFYDEELYYDLYQKVTEKWSDTEYIVDGSKMTRRLVYLNEMDRYDIKVIHLLREPGGNYYSNKKRNKTDGVMSEYIKWCKQHLIARSVLQRLFVKDDYKVLRYKDLATTPKAVMDNINSWLGTNTPKNNFSEKMNEKTNHIFSGNPIRFKEINKIYYNDKWRSELTCYEKGMADIASNLVLNPLLLDNNLLN